MKKIAVTGTMASGKSTAVSYLRELNYPVFDADAVSRKCLDPAEEGYTEVIRHFGREILNEDDTINRKALASVIFGNEENRLTLNGIVHPYVKRKLFEFFAEHEDHPLVFAEIPLLYEVHWEDLFDQVVVITCDRRIAIARCIEYRNYTAEEAIKRLDAQADVQKQIAEADQVFYNNGTQEELRQEIDLWLAKIKN